MLKKLTKDELLNLQISTTTAISIDEEQEYSARLKVALLDIIAELKTTITNLSTVIKEKTESFSSEYKSLYEDYKEVSNNGNELINPNKFILFKVSVFNIPDFKSDVKKTEFSEKLNDLYKKHEDNFKEIRELLDTEVEFNLPTITVEDLHKKIPYEVIETFRKTILVKEV